jgi:hypothetical protein
VGCRFSHARLSYIGSRELSEKKFGSRDNKILFSLSKKIKEVYFLLYIYTFVIYKKILYVKPYFIYKDI